MAIPYGVSSMVSPLEHVLVQAPTTSFITAFDDPAHGYLRGVNGPAALTEHAAFCELLVDLGVTVHYLDGSSPSPDLIYTYDASFMIPAGAILLRSGKATRVGEEDVHAAWYEEAGIPIIGRIEAPGTVDGGDLMWLGPDLLVAGRSLRTNQEGLDQIAQLVDAEMVRYDVPVHGGSEACIHLMSVVSMISDNLALVEEPLMPAGLFHLLERGNVDMINLPRHEAPTLGGNVLAVRPGVVVITDGNPETTAALVDHGVEVHAFPGEEIALNGTGGPTCLTRPIWRN